MFISSCKATSLKLCGLYFCCGQVLYLLLTGEGGYFRESQQRLSQLVKDYKRRGEGGGQQHNQQGGQRRQKWYQKAASIALSKLLNEEIAAFDTPYTNQSQVLKYGFPIQWEQCTLQSSILSRRRRRRRRPVKQQQFSSNDDKDEGMKDDDYDYDERRSYRRLQSKQSQSQSQSKSNPPIRVVVLGGSSSAHSGKNCSYESHIQPAGDPLAGRYSNILMHELYEDFFFFHMEEEEEDDDDDDDNSDDVVSLEFDIINRAHGNTDSVWNALLLDELLLEEEEEETATNRNKNNKKAPRNNKKKNVIFNADLLIVEYGINDALGGTTKRPHRTDQHLAQMMNLWLWRVYSLYRSSVGKQQQQQQQQQQPKPPPPILFVYLWDANFYYKEEPNNNNNGSDNNGTTAAFRVNANHLIHEGIGQTSWKAQKPVIDYYRNTFGWTGIGAINVGAVVSPTVVAKNPYVLLDDKHHPNCATMHLISSMIRHVIYTDLIQCDNHNSNSKNRPALMMNPSSHHHHSNNKNNNSHSAFGGSSRVVRPMQIRADTTKRGGEVEDDDNNNNPAADDEEDQLLQVLLSDNVKVGSIMKWKPNTGSSSLYLSDDSDYFINTAATNNDANATKKILQADHGTKSYPWRADRKISFTLPRCGGGGGNSNNKRAKPIHFTLLEPNLQWLGIGYKIPPPPPPPIAIDDDDDDDDASSGTTTVIEMTINSVSFQLSSPPPPPEHRGIGNDNHNEKTDTKERDDSTPQQRVANNNNNNNNMIRTNHTVLAFDEALIIKEWIKVTNHLPPPPPTTTSSFRVSFCYKILPPPRKPIRIPTLEDCPYKSAATIQQVCDLWSHDNYFNRDQLCPYKQLETISQVCFNWHDEELAKVEEEHLTKNTNKQTTTTTTAPATAAVVEPPGFKAPQVNWIVGVTKK